MQNQPCGRVLFFSVEDFKKIKLVHAEVKGSVVEIRGANGAGKSSVLDAIQWAICGGRALPAKPVRKGADAAEVILKTENYTITRRITQKGTASLTLLDKDGQKVARPSDLLEKWMSDLAIDPLAFCEMKGAEQTQTLLRAAGLTGKLDELDAKHREAVEARRVANVTYKSAQAVATATPLVDGPDEEVSAADILTEIEAARKHNEAAAKAEKWLSERKANMAEYQRIINELEEQLLTTRDRLAKEEALYTEHRAKAEAMQPKNYDHLQASLRTVEADNAAARKRAEACTVAARAKEAQKAADEAERVVADLVEERQGLLTSAKLPVPGLSIHPDDGAVMFNGQPFDQASTAERIKVGVAVALAQKPELKLVLIQRGESLDQHSMQALEQAMVEHDAVAMVERVVADADVASGVEIVSGEEVTK